MMIDNQQAYRFLADAPTALQWLSYLRQSGQAEKHQLAEIGRDILVIKTRQSEEVPIYLRALSAIGAVISGALFLYLLFLFGLFGIDKISLSINGLVFIALSALLHARGLRKENLGRDFYIQLALTLLQVGKFALVAGLVQVIQDAFDISWIWTLSVILGLVMVISYFAFPSRIERFVSAFSFLFSLWVCLLIESPKSMELLFFDFLLVAHLLLLAAFLRWPIVRQRLTSFYDALLISLCLAIGLIESFISVGHPSWLDMPSQMQALMGFGYQWSVQISLAVALIILIFWVSGGKGAMAREPILISVVGIVALALLSDGGILLALGLMILGFATHRPGQTVLGLMFALVFGFLYYYMLDLTLMQKAIILVASGLILLLGSGYIYWRGWHREADDEHSGFMPDGRLGEGGTE
nr:DUF4401 domain-containing protein [uncultured Cohaesibacter sp.]